MFQDLYRLPSMGGVLEVRTLSRQAKRRNFCPAALDFVFPVDLDLSSHKEVRRKYIYWSQKQQEGSEENHPKALQQRTPREANRNDLHEGHESEGLQQHGSVDGETGPSHM